MRTLFAFILLASPALAQDLISEGAVRIVAHEVGVEIHDRIAATSVTQIFENLDQRQREGTYTFSVPPGASIVEFQMWIDGRIMKGEMIDRKKAEEVYRSIVERKKDPGILDHVRDNTWRVRVFPIPPVGGQVKFLTRYVEVLPCLSGQISYTLPCSIPEERAQKMDLFAIHMDVHSSAPVSKIEGAGMSVVRKSPTQFSAKGDRTNIAFDRDLVLRYEARPAGQDLVLMAHRAAKNDGSFLLSVSPDLVNAAADRVPREVIYLLDASGSMEDKLFRRLAASIAEGLRELGPKDRFNVLAFNTEITRFQKNSLDPTPANLKGAASFLDKLRPQGRTDLAKALLDVASAKATTPRMVFVVSDGSASAGCLDPGTIVKEAMKALDADTVVYGIQVGQAGDRTLETLARRSGGECVAADENGIEKMLRAAQKRFARPVLTNVRFEFGGADVYAVHTPRLQFADEPILVAGRYRAAGSHEVTMTGRMGDHDVIVTRVLEFPERHDGWSSAAYVWAGRQISSLLDEAFLSGETEAIRGAVAALSREHRIMTPYTAFLVLETDQMYAQFGLERTVAESRPLFAPPRKGKGLKNDDGAHGLPEPLIKLVDLYAASADSSLLESLRWLAANAKQFSPFKEGDFTLSGVGVSALALQALEVSGAYGLSDEDRRRFEEAMKEMLASLKKAQGRNGQIGETICDHVFAAEALARLLRWHPELLGTKEMLQKAVSYLSDQPGLLEKRGIAALAAPAIMLAKELRLEVDQATIKLLEKSVDGATDAVYLRAQMALDPYLARDARVIAAARRLVEKGPVDPVSAYLGTEALYGWRGEASSEWKSWQQKMETFKRTTDGGNAWTPRGRKEEARAACTAFRTLALEESNIPLQKR
jgi:Ca-activated chloride channel family protein